MTPVNPWRQSAFGESPASKNTVWAGRFRMVSTWLGWVVAGAGILCFVDALLCEISPGYAGFLWPGPSCQSVLIGLSFLLTGLGTLAARLVPRASAMLQSVLGAPVLFFGILAISPSESWFVREVDVLTGWLFLLFGGALMLEGTHLRMPGLARQLALFAIFFLCGLVLVGYAYEFRTHQSGMAAYLGIPWSTALTGLVAAHALLFQHPRFGVMGLLSGDRFGSYVLRRLIPSMVLLLGGVGWIVTYGKGHFWYPAAFGEGLFATLAIAGFSAVLLVTVHYLNNLDGERRLREWELNRNQEQLRAVLDNANAIICMKDPSGRYLLVNERFCRMVGKPSADCVGKSAEELLSPDEARAAETGFREALDTGRPAERVDVVEGIKGTHSYLSANIPLLDAEGNVYAVCGIYTDVTELRNQKEEIRRLNESLLKETRRQASANDELEAFSYSVSHDLRAPLRHITGFAQLLFQRNRDSLDTKSRHYLEVIQTSVDRMGTLIDDLLAFSRANKVDLARRRVRTEELVREVREELLAHHGGTGAEWSIGSLPDMYGDPALLRLVWTNLLSNALKYSGKHPAPRVEVGYGAAGKETAAFWVRDNGAGFDMRYADKLFGVFQRLHSSKDYEGTGIGLALVRRILERHGGRIWAEAFPGQGACFYFILPETRFAKTAESPSKGSET